jgi:hypothetical protein
MMGLRLMLVSARLDIVLILTKDWCMVLR